MNLDALLLAGDAGALIAALAAIPEAERRRHHPAAARAVQDFRGGEWVTDGKVSRWQPSHTPDQQRCAVLAACGTCTLGELKKVASWALFPEVVDLWAALRPAFLPDVAEAIVEANVHNYPVVRALVRAGLCPRPTSPAYTIGLIAASQRKDLTSWILDDPGILDDDVWRLFEVEGGGEFSLAATDKYSRESWSAVLRELADVGMLDRDRLLDASLSALERDFAQFRAGWFSRFHEALAPTPAERAARLPAYVRLLASPIGPTMSFALDAVASIGAPVDAADLEPALRSRAQAHARAALKLLPRTREGALVATVALAHEAAAVQKLAFDLIDAHRDDPGIREAVAVQAAFVAPTLRDRLTRFTEVVAEPVFEASAVARVAWDDPSRRLVPIASLDEAIEVLARLLEDDTDPDEVERALVAAARFRGQDIAKRPIVARARKLVDKASEHPVRHGLARLVVGWATGKWPPGVKHLADHGPYPLLEARLVAIARGAASTLSEPTHRGGWIAPAALVERVRGGGEYDRIDAVVALLRLAPGSAATHGLGGELGDALRFALGEDVPVGPTAALWIAARPHDPAVAARHPGLGPYAGHLPAWAWTIRRHEHWSELIPSVEPSFPADVPLEHVAVRLARGPMWDRALTPWACSLWPAGVEAFCAGQRPSLWMGFEDVGCRALLGGLRHASLGPLARGALGLHLAAKDPGESGLAVDIVISALADGRLDGEALGEALAALRPSGRVLLARWAKTLGVVAGAGHGAAVGSRSSARSAATRRTLPATRGLSSGSSCSSSPSGAHASRIPRRGPTSRPAGTRRR